MMQVMDRLRPRSPAGWRSFAATGLLAVLVTNAGGFGPRESHPVTATAAAESLLSDSVAYRTTRAALPPHFAEFETTRYIVLSDAEAGWVRCQADRLERAHHQFQRYCRQLSLDPAPLRHKLVAVIFDDRVDYQHFARRHDDVFDPALSGYYSPRNDRVVFYNVHANPSVAEARVRLDRMRHEIERISHRVSEASRDGLVEEAQTLQMMHTRYHQQWSRQQQRVDEFSAQTCIATTVHEAIHQLMFHTGIQSARVRYPLWICEGFATAFETDQPNAAFGPEHEYAPRREGFRQILRGGELLPLRRLVQIDRFGHDDGDLARVVYHQSYALLGWVSRFRSEALRDYLERLRMLEDTSPDGQDLVEIFELSFGDIERLERSWLRHERGRQPS